ncbi:MAG: trypsin-like peptidase domain-containing protein [Candidatus Nealsonbacteria bacterium]|nr:trypsin-like peptidase domain-containing protein [Candidatus Nealsonbacteria bacterium]
MLTNGKRIDGKQLTGWGEPAGTVQLDGQPLLHPSAPLRWLYDHTLPVAKTPKAYIEFVGGDRLPCTIVGARRSIEVTSAVGMPDHLVVEPRLTIRDAANRPLQQLHVSQRMIRRIVWQDLGTVSSLATGGTDRYRPATVFYRDGSQRSFRRHRFLAGAVRLLTDDGTQSVPLEKIAELHLPRIDPWEAYYDEVAALSPELKDRLLRLETTTGLIATASTARLRVASYSNAAEASQWHHLIHPAWSLEAFAVQHARIRVRHYFAAHEVPLLRVAPLEAVNRSAIHAGWHWQRDRSVFGRPLQEGPHGHGWGFGVHGHSELKFPLPPSARQFRTRAKLDGTSGTGGCVRAIVRTGTIRPGDDLARPRNVREVYRSDVLIGSKAVLDTGNRPLAPPGAGETGLLMLAVDPLDRGHPKEADPLDIRDNLNWLEPTVLLDRGVLAGEVSRRWSSLIVPLSGWTLTPAEPPPRPVGFWDVRPGKPEAYRFAVASGKASLVLSRRLTLTAHPRWLIVAVSRPQEQMPGSTVEVLIDGKKVAGGEVPLRLAGAEEPSPLVVPLPLAGVLPLVGAAVELPAQRSTVELQIVQRAVDNNAQNAAVDWRAISIVDRLPMLREVFEDHADWEVTPAENRPGDRVKMVSEGAYGGSSCLKIAAGATCRIEIPHGPAAIRGGPAWGEYRYIRFAFRKRGRGQVRIEFDHDGAEQQKLHYFAGRGPASDPSAKRVWVWSTHADLPDEWIVETRDLHGDFGRLATNLSHVSLSCVAAEYVLFDHVYLAAAIDDFELGSADRIATPDAAARTARAAMARVTLDRAFPATVLLGCGERVFSGVIVSHDGLVLTAGHCVVEPDRDVAVILADGRQVRGKSLGVDRANDAAMVRITDEGAYPYVKIAPAGGDLSRELLLAVAHQADYEPGDRPMAHLTWTVNTESNLLETTFSGSVIGSGGPLLIATNDAAAEGQLIGVHGRRAWTGFVYTPVERYRENWQRLLDGEAWGQWAGGSGPLLGVFTAEEPGVCKISQLVPDGPAAKAGLQVGDLIRAIDGQGIGDREALTRVLGGLNPGGEVPVKIQRGDQTLDKPATLGGRK